MSNYGKVTYNEKHKKILIGIAVAVVVVVGTYSMLTTDIKHIEDTNGADNYNLQQITDYMLGTVRENTHHGSLLTWVKSFNWLRWKSLGGVAY